MNRENIFFPNTTQVPNFVFDVLMAKCGKAPTRFFVLLAIIRKTYGWQKHEDLLSLSQIIELTGMSKNAVKDALKFWQKEKVIKLLSKGDGRKISKYRCLLYDYIDTQGVIQKYAGGQPMIPTESTNDTYRGQSVTPQNQENNNQKQLTKEPEKLTSSKFIEYKNRLRSIDEKFNLSYLESSKANQYYEQAQKKYEELNSNKSFAEFFESILTKLEKLTSQKLDRFAFKQGFTIESLVKFDLQGCAKVEAWFNDCYPSGYSSQNSQYQGYDKEQLKKEGWIV